MQILEGISNVSESPFFWFYMGTVVVFGMVIGGKLNEYAKGFTRSMAVLLPFTFTLVVTNLSRIYFVAQNQYISPTAFNGLVTIILTSFFYILGLFLGHIVVSKAIRDAHKEFRKV